MSRQIRKVAVLGAGVMGAGIAAHLANAGIPSLLFDLERPHKALKALLKQKPKPLMHPTFASMIEPCSFGEDAARLSEVDWVVEAVTERLDIKRKVFQTVRDNAGPDTIVTSNTSGIPIASITEGTSEAFRKNFFVTHFFNPPRYMKLLELVDGPETDPELFEWFSRWGERRLGKGIVIGKDTPNFVANRIGTYGMMALLHKVVEQGFTVPQIDKIFGKAMGRPNSAIFRTADMVGLDTLAHVAKNCFDTLTEDPHREVFQLPGFVNALLERGDLGSKTGAGFYKKTKDADGKKAILALNLDTLEYEAQEKVRYASLGAVREIEDSGARVKKLLSFDDDAARIAWEATADTLLYSAALLGEICDDVVAIDNAMKWGYAWDQGPFEGWDAIGVAESVQRMRDEGREIPAVVEAAVKAGGWYHRDEGVTRFLDVKGNGELKPAPTAPGAIFLNDVRETGGVVKKNMGATLLDLGDGILNLEFHTKMNSLDADIIGLYGEALDMLDASNDWAGLVVGNEGNGAFSAGANIMLVMMAAMAKEWGQIEDLTRGLQDTVMRAKYSDKPVITAPHGLTLGGGAEVAMHSSGTVATGELYMGLVEVGVGLLPAGGGCTETVWRIVGSVPEGINIDVNPFVQKAFMQIGMGKVAESADEARGCGYLRPHDQISLSKDHQIADAKALALGLANAGYVAPKRRSLKLPGRDGMAAINTAIWGMVGAEQISEHDAKIGKHVARVLCGGDVTPGTARVEQDLLDLEREAFLSLCGEEKTIARIQHMLMKGKPLRN